MDNYELQHCKILIVITIATILIIYLSVFADSIFLLVSLCSYLENNIAVSYVSDPHFAFAN